MSLDKKVKKDIIEMVEYVLENDSYLKSKLKSKKSVNIDVKGIDDDIKNVKNEVTKKGLKLMRDNMLSQRGSELVRNYGGLILNKRIVDKVLGRKKKK